MRSYIVPHDRRHPVATPVAFASQQATGTVAIDLSTKT
jgi:hypothetical protein